MAALLNEQVFLVDGARVSFSMHESGPLWKCGQCAADCPHVLIAAARMTLSSWEQEDAALEGAVFAE